jgi:Family of unknown function (DUF5678)
MGEAVKKDIPTIEPCFYENQRKFPPDELSKFAGKHVAWSLDGTRILASGDTDEEVENNLLALGIAPNRVAVGYVDPPDISYL